MRVALLTVMLMSSLLANLLLGLNLMHYISDYERLLLWACVHGNGGHDCGEE